MTKFKGFPEGKLHLVSIPFIFFKELLPDIDHLGELRLSLYIFWRLSKMEGTFRFLREADFSADESLMHGLGDNRAAAQAALLDSLQRAVHRGTLLRAEIPVEGDPPSGVDSIYFLNSPKGRAALRAIESGKWRPGVQAQELPPEASEPPNIFRLYEENIGALTPMIAEALTEAEQTYPAEWIEEAIHIAVENNKRNWRYALAILERWRQEGKHGRKEKPENRRDAEETRRRYVEGEFSDFIKH
jgi:DNA replication protein